MSYWIVPWNNRKFNLPDCLNKFDGLVDWRQFNNFGIGDRVFMYCSLPEGRITHLLEVLETNIPYEKSLDDNEFYLEGANWKGKIPPKGYVRLTLVSSAPQSSILKRHSLVESGMPTNIQSAVKVSGHLLTFILSGFESMAVKRSNNQFVEGLSHTIAQTYYERDPEARLECLKHYGNKYSCEICGFNFKDVYGEIGKDFIHVHHINFLSGNKGIPIYTNPKEDLIPVCPNCHAMLHRKIKGVFITPFQLRVKFRK